MKNCECDEYLNNFSSKNNLLSKLSLVNVSHRGVYPLGCKDTVKIFHLCIGVFQVSADWERASLRPGSQPSSVFKSSPVMETYTTEGGFINTNLVTGDEESQEFDDLIFALKTGEDTIRAVWQICL